MLSIDGAKVITKNDTYSKNKHFLCVNSSKRIYFAQKYTANKIKNPFITAHRVINGFFTSYFFAYFTKWAFIHSI